MNTRISFLFGGLLVLASTEGQASEKQPGFTECTGRTQAIQEVQLRARVSGYLEKVLFEPGTEVKRDQILFQIDPLPYKAQVVKARASLDVARAQLELAQANWKRGEALAPTGGISKEELEQRRQTVKVNEATVKVAAAEVEVQQINLTWTTIRAPMNGKIGRPQIDAGNLVVADKTTLATIVSLDSIEVAFDIDERTALTILKLVQEGKFKNVTDIPVTMGLVSEEGLPHKGTVKALANKVDPKTGTLQVRAEFPNPKGLLLPGLFVRVRLPVEPVGSKTDIQFETKTGTLFGTLDLPKGDGPFPVVVIIAGSGPTDRDGNSRLTKNDCLKLLGQGLAAKGVAALRYDKRGIAKSAAAGAREQDLRFEMYADDAAAWVELLRKDGRFSRVGIVGHSEGSLLGMLAARKAKADAFVSLAGAGRGAPVVIREQLKKNLKGELQDKAFQILDDLVAGREVKEVPKELAALYRPSVQAYLISWFKYDPTKEIATLTMPALVVQGTSDIQIPESDAKLLAAAMKEKRVFIKEGMNHLLKMAATEDEQKAAYSDPSLPLAPGLVDHLAEFLGKHLGAKK
jgi:RND family efflux transporter MFP subunit